MNDASMLNGQRLLYSLKLVARVAAAQKLVIVEREKREKKENR